MLLPNEVIKKIEKNEVENISHLILRLQGQREYPIRVPLKTPTVKTIMKDIASYENFVRTWNDFPYQEMIERVTVNYRYGVQGENIPSEFIVHDFEELIKLISSKNRNAVTVFIERCKTLSHIMHYDNLNNLYSLYRELNLEAVSNKEFSDLMICMPQLKRGLGKDYYLRAIPIEHIDTKFIEKHDKVILSILRTLSLCSEDESLEDYLEVEAKPDGFAHIRVLDDSLVERYPYMMVPSSLLLNIEPPGDNLIVVENVQSGLMLPKLKNTSVIFGCGRNLSWSKASWLKHKKQIFYWGDLDSWGFQMLCEFRENSQCTVKSLLMDKAVFNRASHTERMVHEDKSTEVKVEFLTEDEKQALAFLQGLQNNVSQNSALKSETAFVLDPDTKLNRLEQEKLDEDAVIRALKEQKLL